MGRLHVWMVLLSAVRIDIGASLENLYYENRNVSEQPIISLYASGCGGGGWEGAVSVAAEVLSRGGVPAARRGAARCGAAIPRDAPECLRDVLIQLKSSGDVGAELCALVGAQGAGCLVPWLLELNFHELGDSGAPVRRLCLASPTHPEARALSDLADASVAQNYALHGDDLHLVNEHAEKGENGIYIPPQCAKSPCGIMLVGSGGELQVARSVVLEGALRVRVMSVGAALRGVLERLTGAALACGWRDELAPLLARNATPLAPPLCSHVPRDVCDPFDPAKFEACPFEARRIVKVVDKAMLQKAPLSRRVLERFSMSSERLAALERGDPDGSARGGLAARWAAGAAPRRVHVAALVPVNGQRRAARGVALAAAVALAAKDAPDELKVYVKDSQCSARRAMRLVTDEVGWGGFAELSALAGPACGGALQQAQAWGAMLGLPVLAYTPAAAAGGAALLAAGETRTRWLVLGALLARYEWRRVAMLSEAAVRPNTTLLDAELILNEELPDDDSALAEERIKNWVHRAAHLEARVLVVSAEDARVLRAALCAARRARLQRGAVWLLPRAPDRAALRAPCAQYAAGGVFAVADAWEDEWPAAAAASAWRDRWRASCLNWRKLAHNATEEDCAAPPADAALLYDTLMLWGRALTRLRTERPEAFDELHDPDVVRALFDYVTDDKTPMLTGPFEWEGAGSVRVRQSALVVTQWRAEEGRAARVARWAGGALRPAEELPRWDTADGRPPRAAPPACALAALAAPLHLECEGAWAALLSAIAALLFAALLATVSLVRRRFERHYKQRMELAMCPLLGEPPLLRDWEISRDKIVITRSLGMGAFGKVWFGYAELKPGDGRTAVAVKTLRRDATNKDKVEFLYEAEMMKRFNHKNVVRLLGVVMADEPIWTVMEFLRNGDLRQYLLARHDLALSPTCKDGEDVSPRWLTSVALDAACALSYLAEKRYVHCDVAARNCLLTGSRQLKLADFGMTQPMFENDCVKLESKKRLPVRWMAPESLSTRGASGVFTPASDVWSFGLLLYEIVTFGSLPYHGLSNFRVMDHVLVGGICDIPAGIKPQLEGLMKLCWHFEPAQRPAAHEVVAHLADAPELLTASRAALLSPWYGTVEGGDEEGRDTDVTYLSESQPDLVQV